jgi:hypothetical protein
MLSKAYAEFNDVQGVFSMVFLPNRAWMAAWYIMSLAATTTVTLYAARHAEFLNQIF